jgi:hypothetical protein
MRPYLGRARLFIILIKERNFPYPVFLKIPQKLPEYAPNSAGNYRELTLLTLKTAKNIFPRINEMVGQSKLSKVISTDHFTQIMDFEELTESINKFELLFNFYKSDKATNHKYQFIYGPIIAAIGNSGNLLEIGMGTNNTQFASNMGKRGHRVHHSEHSKTYCLTGKFTVRILIERFYLMMKKLILFL